MDPGTKTVLIGLLVFAVTLVIAIGRAAHEDEPWHDRYDSDAPEIL